MGRARRGWRTSRIFFVVLWIVMLAGSVFIITILVNRVFLIGFVRRLTSLDWAGYVVVSDQGDPQPVVVGVSGTWIVPRVRASVDDRFCAAWVGIGGQLDSTLIQTGVEQDSVNGQVTYSAWYELLPDIEVTITTLNVSPGDKIKASINLVDSVTNKWSIELEDVTKGQRFSHEFFYESSRLSAEWIVERPTVDGRLSTLADFGNLTFTEAQANLTTSVDVISSFPYSQVIMDDRQNRQLVTVSSLTSQGSSFTVNYLTVLASTQTQIFNLFENRIALAPLVSTFSRQVSDRAILLEKISCCRHLDI